MRPDSATHQMLPVARGTGSSVLQRLPWLPRLLFSQSKTGDKSPPPYAHQDPAPCVGWRQTIARRTSRQRCSWENSRIAPRPFGASLRAAVPIIAGGGRCRGISFIALSHSAGCPRPRSRLRSTHVQSDSAGSRGAVRSVHRPRRG